MFSAAARAYKRAAKIVRCICGTCCGGIDDEPDVPQETEALVRDAASSDAQWTRMMPMLGRPGAAGGHTASSALAVGGSAAAAAAPSSAAMDADVALARSLQEEEMAAAFLQALTGMPPGADPGGPPVFHPSLSRAARNGRLARFAAAGHARAQQESAEEAAARAEREQRRRALRTLPTRAYVENSMKEDASCAICLGDYVAGEKIRTLPCLHVFHQECVDVWLVRKGLCPSCNWSISSTEFGAF